MEFIITIGNGADMKRTHLSALDHLNSSALRAATWMAEMRRRDVICLQPATLNGLARASAQRGLARGRRSRGSAALFFRVFSC